MLKFILIITFSILFAGCVNEVGDGSSTIIAPGDEETDENDEETGENDEETDENDEETGAHDEETGKKNPSDDDLPNDIPNDIGVGGDWQLGGGQVMGCMLEDAPNYNSEANLPCTINCIDNKTGSNCCCED